MGSTNIDVLISWLIKTKQEIWEHEKRTMDSCSMFKLAAMKYISDRKEASMKDVAVFLKITPPSATSLINGLVKSGYLGRISDKKDRRIIRLSLTPTGEKVLADGFKRIQTMLQKIFMRLTEKERENLIKILEKLSIAYHPIYE